MFKIKSFSSTIAYTVFNHEYLTMINVLTK